MDYYPQILEAVAYAALTLNVPYISESCFVMKIKLIFIFTLLFGPSKGFMKTFKVFIKHFEAPQRSVKIKVYWIFSLLSGLGRKGLRENHG